MHLKSALTATVQSRSHGAPEHEAVVDLNTRALLSLREVPDVQPSLLIDEIERVPQIVRADAAWRRTMERRGIKDFV